MNSWFEWRPDFSHEPAATDGYMPGNINKFFYPNSLRLAVPTGLPVLDVYTIATMIACGRPG
jgi:hypothetical protein